MKSRHMSRRELIKRKLEILRLRTIELEVEGGWINVKLSRYLVFSSQGMRVSQRFRKLGVVRSQRWKKAGLLNIRCV